MAFDLQRFTLLPVPLTRTAACGATNAALAAENPAVLFPGARDPAAALSGLMLMLGCWEASHELSQENGSAEGNYWHAIAHRIEPDSFNSSYWFRRVGRHPIFPELHSRAGALLSEEHGVPWKLKSSWDPALFVEWCEEARSKPQSVEERVALAIQNAECELLLAWCAEVIHNRV